MCPPHLDSLPVGGRTGLSPSLDLRVKEEGKSFKGAEKQGGLISLKS